MTTERGYRGGRPRTQRHAEDPLVTVSLQVRQRQLAALDQRADAAHTSRAALVREAIDGLLTRLQRLLTRLKRPSSWRTGGASATRTCSSRKGVVSSALQRCLPRPRHDPRRPPARLESGDPAHTSQEMP
jgi:hypothetical protein